VTRSSIRFLAAFALTLVSAIAAFAQAPSTASPSARPLAEPDFTLIGLPTSLRLPKFKGAFRVTHRFTRPIDCDTCPNSFVADGFGTDGGAVIGLEYRFGIVPNGEIGVLRTADKTVELFGQYGLLRQGADAPVEASALAAVDVNNVGRRGADSNYSPVLGVIVSRLIGDQAAVHVEPIWVHHTNLFEQRTVASNDTFLVGLGARLRVRPTVYLVGEFSPRVSGYQPGVNQGSFGVEKRLRGHMFQLNLSNSFGTTLSQIARGAAKEVRPNGTTKQNWYFGFNITRKFF